MQPRERRTAPRRALAGVAGAAREPVILIMITAGIFEFLSGDAISHGTILIAGALVIGWDHARRRVDGNAATLQPGRDAGASTTVEPGLIGSARSIPASVGLVAAVAYAAVVGGFARFTWPITIAIAIPGALAIIAVWRDPSPRPSVEAVDRLGAVAWAAVFVALGLWELTQLLMQPALTINSYAHPTISVALDPLLNHHHLDRSIGLFLWLAFGWYLIER